MHQQNLLTIDEAARIAHVSRDTIRYWIKIGRIKPEPIRISKRSGKPYGKLVPRGELFNAMPDERIRVIKRSHPGNLLTVNEIAKELKVTKQLAYKLIRRHGLEKIRVDGWNFLVDGHELWDKLEDDPTYRYLTHQ